MTSLPLRVQAASNDVVINEIMYNPLSDDDNDEFLELYNPTTSTISLEGWCFTEGISLCFEAGDEITAGSYILVSPNAAQTQTTYGKTTLAEYTGKLSNGGEAIVLRDDQNQIASTFTYDDNTPWPISPDGTGPSLELIQPVSDVTQPSSWAASLSNGGTPEAENSVTGADLPELTELSTPTNVQPTDSPIVTVQASNATTVNLVYKVMFDADATVSMNDNGIGADTTASDGIYSASIPSQTAGSLVRYKVAASNMASSINLPGTDDSFNYKGYLIQDGKTANIPIVRWYMDDADFTDMTTNHLTDNMYFEAVVVAGDQVFDNSKVRVKGEVSVNYPKKKYRFELPQGYTLGQPYFTHPVDEFAINRWGMPNMATAGEHLAWKTAELAGFKTIQTQQIEVYKNDQTTNQESQGLYLMIELYDKQWRERNDYQDGALYKTGNDKKTRLDEDNSDIQDLVNNIDTLTDDDLKVYLTDNLNIPAIINYHALMTVTRSQDWGFNFNIYQYRDTDGTGRWEYLPWDLDNAFALTYIESGQDWLLAPPTNNHQGPANKLETALYQFPEFKEMYYRRSIQLFNDLYGPSNQLEKWSDDIYADNYESIERDLNKWQASYVDLVSGITAQIELGDVFSGTVEEFYQQMNVDLLGRLYQYDINRNKASTQNFIANGQLPEVQDAKTRVVINEFNYNPSGGNQYEYIELYNPNNYAVDISEWSFTEGVQLSLPGGSVIPAGGYALVVNNDKEFRSHYGGGKLILAEYSGKLSNNGETITLSRADGSVSSSLDYETSGNWSDLANGGGYSQALIRATADESLATCWAPAANGGTPGLVNSNFDQQWLDSHEQDCKNRDTGSNSGTSSLANTGTNTQTISMLGFSLIVLAGLLMKTHKGYGKISVNKLVKVEGDK